VELLDAVVTRGSAAWPALLAELEPELVAMAKNQRSAGCATATTRRARS